MSLPYQPRFVYRRRKNTPVPSPYGEYVKPSSGFDGFSGPEYTLGSLSNRPGSDWATPKYVRDEPVMFMAGFGGCPPEGAIDNGDGSYIDVDGTKGYCDRDTGRIDPETPAQAMARLLAGTTAKTMGAASASFWDAVKGELAKYGQAGLNLLSSKGEEIANRVASGEDPAKVINEVSGGTIKITTTPPQYVPAPPAGALTPAQQILALNIGNAQVTTLKPGTAATAFLRPPAFPKGTTSKMVMILGAVAVGAFLLLKKR